jgi:hypothetical protein
VTDLRGGITKTFLLSGKNDEKLNKSDILAINRDLDNVFNNLQSRNYASAGNKFGDRDTNYTNFDSTGHQTMVGNARPWRDQVNDALGIKQNGNDVTTNSTESTVEFSTTADLNDYLHVNIQLNHDKDLTSSIYPHIHFFQDQNAVPNFLLQYRWQVDLASKTTAWTNLKCNTLAVSYTAGTINQIAYANPISVPVGSTLSDIVQFRVIRDNANTSTVFSGADPYSGAVGITSFDIHFQINSLGSDEQYSK